MDSDRAERLLAQILLQHIKGSPQREKIHHLNLSGFSNVEIADLLETTPAVVAQGLYEMKKAKKTKPKSRAQSGK